MRENYGLGDSLNTANVEKFCRYRNLEWGIYLKASTRVDSHDTRMDTHEPRGDRNRTGSAVWHIRNWDSWPSNRRVCSRNCLTAKQGNKGCAVTDVVDFQNSLLVWDIFAGVTAIMSGRRGLVVPQNTFLDNIIKKTHGTRKCIVLLLFYLS